LTYSINHYRLADLSEEDGKMDKAIRVYQRFLKLWNNADEQFKEKKDAEIRLSRLKTLE